MPEMSLSGRKERLKAIISENSNCCCLFLIVLKLAKKWGGWEGAYRKEKEEKKNAPTLN